MSAHLEQLEDDLDAIRQEMTGFILMPLDRAETPVEAQYREEWNQRQDQLHDEAQAVLDKINQERTILEGLGPTDGGVSYQPSVEDLESRLEAIRRQMTGPVLMPLDRAETPAEAQYREALNSRQDELYQEWLATLDELNRINQMAVTYS